MPGVVRSRRTWPTMLGVMLGVMPSMAWAQPAATAALPAAMVLPLRIGRHPGFVRVVFDLPPGVMPLVSASDAGVSVRVPGSVLALPAHPGGDMAGWRVAGDHADLSLAPGQTAHRMQMPGRLVVDVAEAAVMSPRRAALASAASAPAASASAQPVRDRSLRGRHPSPSAPLASSRPAEPDRGVTQPAVRPPTLPPVGMSPPVVSPRPPPGALTPPAPAIAVAPGGSVLLPFAFETGAAAFRRGTDAILVFDEARPVDVAGLPPGNPLAGAQVQVLAGATLVTFPLAASRQPRLRHVRSGWRIELQDQPATPAAMVLTLADGHADLALAASATATSGQVVSVPDPLTGGQLQVGTLRGGRVYEHAAGVYADEHVEGAGTMQGVSAERRLPDFTLLPSWQGVALEPGSDNVSLRPVMAGFRIQSGRPDGALTLTASGPDPDPDMAGVALLSRRFDLPALPLAALSQRLQTATDAAAAAPTGDRGAARVTAAQAMLALGMGAEAQAVLALATAEDARLIADPLLRSLSAAAALVAGRPGEAAALDDPAPPGPPELASSGLAAKPAGQDEMTLWHDLRAAMVAAAAGRAVDVATADGLAARMALLLSYPAPLRDRLLPMAVAALADTPHADAARRIAAGRPDDAGLDFARALLATDSSDARTRLAALGQSSDRSVRVRAAVALIEARRAGQEITAGQAADALDPLIYAWRGDGREGALRLRVAALRDEAGQFRQALTLLRESADPALAEGWPDQRDALRAALAGTFAHALERDRTDPLPPLDLVTLAEENADLMPEGEAGQAVANRIADRLMALDLPDQAAGVLTHMMEQAAAGPARAELGVRLAGLALDRAAPQDALLALSASNAETLSQPLRDGRTLLFARASAARGELAPALGALAGIDPATHEGATAERLRAELLERSQSWPEAEAAWSKVALRELPPVGPLDATQAGLLVRVAAAAGQAGDEAALTRLREAMLPRVAASPTADTLRQLTMGLVRTAADLPGGNRVRSTLR